MATGRDLIKGAFRLLGVYEAGENPSADEINDALASLNELKDSLNLQDLISYQTLSQTYPFIGNQATYTFGTGGDFAIATPPVEIVNVTIRDIDNEIDLPCVIITDKDYSAIVLKDTASPIPFYVLIEQQANNSKDLTFWPVPSSASYGATIYYQSYISTFALDTAITLPPGYLRMLRYNLAIDLAPEYGVSISAEVAKIAKDSLADVKRQNTVFQTIGVDGAIPSGRPPYTYTYADLLVGN